MQTIHFIFRSKQLQRFSIEKVFKVVINSLQKKHTVSQHHLPFYGASPITILKNGLFFKKIKGICHITGDVHYMAIKTGKRTVLSIHDVNSIIRGNFFKKLYLKLFWFWIPAMIVKKITVISDFSKRELSQIIPFAKKKIVVIPNPISPDFKFSTYEFNESRPKVLCVGTKGNKNLLRTIEALKNIKCELAVIGKLKEEQLKSLKENNIDYVNEYNLNDHQMIQAYKECDLLCFPSTYEGFGMPIIEAQASGRLVLTSNIGAMKEVAADSAYLVDPYSVSSIKKGLEKIIHDETSRVQLIEKGLRNVERFHISTIAKQYESLYEELARDI